MRVFVSYSRSYFYLAEDLALALRVRGVDAWFDVHRLQPGDDWLGGIEGALRSSQTFVLVASEESLGSSHVQAELTLARELQLPVVVVLAESVDLPPPLDNAPRFDLRRAFERKLDALVEALNGRAFSVPSGGEAAVVRLLPWVLIAGAVLCGAVSRLEFSTPSTNPLTRLMWISGVPLCLWLAWDIALRKPKRVLPVLVVLVIGALLGVLCVAGGVALAADAARWGRPTIAPLLLLLLGVAMIVPPFWVALSPAFYRWCPTGSAPGWLRRRMLARRGYRRGSAPETAPISYEIHASGPDASVRRALDAALQARKHRPDLAGGTADRQICVVSDLTPLAWLQDTLARVSGRVIVLISAPVSLDALGHVERYQWVDYRRRRRRTLSNLAATIGSPDPVGAVVVPESLGTRVVPLPIFLFCLAYAGASAGAFAVGVSVLFGADFGAVYGEPPSPLITVPAVIGACALPAYTATVLATRQVSLRSFLVLLLGTIVAIIAFQRLLYPGMAVRMFFIPVLAGGFWLAVAWRALVGWLPRDGVDRVVPRLAAAPRRWWHRPAARRTVAAGISLTVFYIVLSTLVTGQQPLLFQPPAQTVLGSGYRLTIPSRWNDVTAQSHVQQSDANDFVFMRGNNVVYVGHIQAVGDAVTLSAQAEQGFTEVGAEIFEAGGSFLLDGEAQTASFGYVMAEPDGTFVSGEQITAVRKGVVYFMTLAAPRDSYQRADFEPVLSGWRWSG